MKKLRMIVTSVIVLAIVGSAFSFNSKKYYVFCIDSNTTTGGFDDCDGTLQGQFIDPTLGTTWYYYKDWDGKLSSCTATNNNKCTITIKLSSLNDAQ